jgi:1,4-dihydroxy-2-naphthoate octaprenyltransferase
MLPFLADRILPRSVAFGSFAALPLVLWGGLRYTRIHSPHPTVLAMIALLLIQLVTWFWVGY